MPELADRQWGIFDRVWNGVHFQHNVPLDDIAEHVLEANTCWCKPTKKVWHCVCPDACGIIIGMLWVHNSLDGREDVQT